MKPILVIDNSPDEPVNRQVSFESWVSKGLVEFASLADEDRIDPDRYGTVFVHQGNEDEVEWARECFSPTPIFVFSGTWTERPPVEDNEVFLPRLEFIERLPMAIKRYEEDGGRVGVDLFDPRLSPAPESPSEPDRDVVSFTTSAEGDSPLCFPILRADDGTVDYLSTLAPLTELADKYSFLIEETYEGGVHGVRLLRRIRMGAFLGGTFSKWPTQFGLDSDLNDLLRQNMEAAVLVTPGVTTSLTDGQPNALTAAGLLRVLESLPVAPGNQSTKHSVANRWGPVRLDLGRRLLRGDTLPASVWSERGRELLREEEYWHLLAQGALKSQVATSHSSEADDDQEAWEDWKQFLQDRVANRPLHVLYVDDEGDLGWDNAVQAFFDEVEGAVDLVCYPGESTLDSGELDGLLKGSWDLVLCDLRLRPEDEDLGVVDPSQRQAYSGIRAIETIKAEDGEAPTPVIAFTASDKSWTHAAALEAGATGYWVKEGPEQGASPSYSRRNAAELLREIREAIVFRDRRRFLWDMILDFRRERARLETSFSALHASTPSPPGGGGAPPTDPGVRDRLDQIEALWLRAYGYLQSTPTPFERGAYRFAPEDMAFLHLYGSLNQIRALRYKLGSNQAAMVRSTGAVQQIVSGTSWAAWADTLRGHVNLKPDMKRAKPWKAGKSHNDAMYNGLLLLDAGRDDLDKALNGSLQAGSQTVWTDGLRGFRNQLDIIHGDVVAAASQPHANIDDHLRPLCDVLKCTVLL